MNGVRLFYLTRVHEHAIRHGSGICLAKLGKSKYFFICSITTVASDVNCSLEPLLRSTGMAKLLFPDVVYMNAIPLCMILQGALNDFCHINCFLSVINHVESAIL